MTGRRKLRGCDAGVAAVEFAIAGPILVFLLLAIIELGRLLWVIHGIGYAVQDTGRFAMVHIDADLAELEARARNALGAIDDGPLVLDLQHETVGEILYLNLRASYDFDFMTRLLPMGPFTLTSESRVPR
jgi:Flp pilus assembly protein TadG